MNSINRKKILLYTRPLAPPWDEASKNLAYEIAMNAGADFEFQVLTTKDIDEKIFDNSKQNIVPKKIYGSAKFGLGEKTKLISLLFGTLDTDVIHFLFTPRRLTSWLVRNRLKTTNIRTLQTIASISPGLLNDPEVLKQALFADRIVAQSHHTAQKLKDARIENVEVIYPGIDLEKYYPSAKDHVFMEKYNVKPEDFVILFAGEYIRTDAIDDVLEAFEILSNRKNSKYRLILACRIKSKQDSAKKQKLINLVEKAGLKDRVEFEDYCDDIVRLFNGSDVNIFPARDMDGKFDIPYAIVEPMACARPNIISDVPVLKEFVEHDKNGIVVLRANPRALANAIEKIKNNPAYARNLSQNALEFARENFDIRKNVRKYERAYANL